MDNLLLFYCIKCSAANSKTFLPLTVFEPNTFYLLPRTVLVVYQTIEIKMRNMYSKAGNRKITVCSRAIIAFRYIIYIQSFSDYCTSNGNSKIWEQREFSLQPNYYKF